MRQVLVILLCLVFSNLFPQAFGGFPPSFHWRMIDIDEVRVIFPKGLEGQAKRVVNTIKYLESHNRSSIGVKKHKINITLQNQTVISNGYVALAPFKSEFFTNPLQESSSLGSIPWLDLLAVHEYRHVLQFTNGRRGFSLFAYLLSGEYGWSVANNLSIPNWFWEGDAVVTETALSEQGRGRLPSFYNPFRSLGLTGTIYKYMKLRNGSYKDYVPNHYNLGYLMCVYGRETYGNEFWKGVFEDAVAYKYIVYPFSRAIYNRTGKRDNSARFYRNTMDYFHQKWKQELDTLRLTKAQNVKTKSENATVTNYQFPYFINDNEIIALKSGYKQIPYFTKIDKNGVETRLKAQGYTTDPYFDYKNGKLVWSEMRYNLRWGNFDYSVLKTFDTHSNKTRTLSVKTKYFSPSLSQGANQIVAVEQTTNQIYTLHILDAGNGNLLKTLPNPENLYYTYPKYTIDNQSIISSVRNKAGEMALISQNIESGEITVLVPFSNNVLGINFPTKDYVYFEASFSGVDNIYAAQFGYAQVYQITSRAIGNYQPALSTDGKTMLFSQFSKTGNKLYSINLDSTGFYLFNIINISQQKKFDFVAVSAEGGSILKKVPNDTFQVKKYSQAKNFINFHSWVITASQPLYGIAFYSDNILNNFSASIGTLYNRNETVFQTKGSVTYGGLFPILEMGAFQNGKRRLITNDSILPTISEEGSYISATVPLNFTKGIYATRLSFQTQYSISNLRYNTQNAASSALNQYSVSEIDFINARRKAYQNIYSPFGQYISLNYKKDLQFKNVSQANVIYEFSFRGLLVNHNFVAEGGYLYDQGNMNYRFLNSFFYPRGYQSILLNNGDFLRLGFNYHFPIIYPDWGFAGLIYFLRIRGNAFFDIGMAANNGNFVNDYFNNTHRTYTSLNSFGGEMIFDISLFNVQPVTIGLRYSYIQNQKFSSLVGQNQVFEVFIPVKRL